jgi:hypothetical protein
MAFGCELLLQASTFPSRHPAIPPSHRRSRGPATDQRTSYASSVCLSYACATATTDPYASANCTVRDWRPRSGPGLSVSSISVEWTLAVRLSGLDAARGATVKWKRLAKRGTHAFAGPLNCSMSLKSRVVFSTTENHHHSTPDEDDNPVKIPSRKSFLSFVIVVSSLDPWFLTIAATLLATSDRKATGPSKNLRIFFLPKRTWPV